MESIILTPNGLTSHRISPNNPTTKVFILSFTHGDRSNPSMCSFAAWAGRVCRTQCNCVLRQAVSVARLAGKRPAAILPKAHDNLEDFPGFCMFHCEDSTSIWRSYYSRIGHSAVVSETRESEPTGSFYLGSHDATDFLQHVRF